MKNFPTYALAFALGLVAFFSALDKNRISKLERQVDAARAAELERGFNEATHMSKLDPVWGGAEDDGDELGARAVSPSYLSRSGGRISWVQIGPGVFPGSSGLSTGGAWRFGSYDGTNAGAWVANVGAPSSTNWVFISNGTGSRMNGSTTVGFSLGGTTNFYCDTNGCYSPKTLEATTYLRSVGVTYATLPAAAAGNKGAIEYDTTNDRLMWSNGTTWAAIPSNGVLAGYTAGDLTANREIIRARMASGAGYVTRVGATVDVAGVGAGNFTIEAYNVTAAAQICVTAAIPCTSAAGGSANVACTGAFALGDDVALRMDQSGCGTAAKLNAYLVAGGGH